jgi:hypothetical protein
MTEQGTVTLYHGTDIESASDIIQNGLNLDNLVRQQDGRPTQLGTGLYTTDQIDIAWYFASAAPGSIGRQYVVVVMEMFQEHLESLFEQGLAVKQEIIGVYFQGDQYWFHPDSFDFLNQQAFFRPYTGNE